MSTLKELFDKHGSVWLADKDKPDQKYILPLAYIEDETSIVCEMAKKYPLRCDDFNPYNNGFILYEEPKPKVKRYLYAYMREGWTHPELGGGYYIDDKDFLSRINGLITHHKRLDSTMQEFDW